MANFLEQLVSEWCEFRGYFVRRNVLVGKRSAGGYECELDVVALDPKSGKVLHIEPSTDASSWEVREKRYAKKFLAGQKYIPDLFQSFEVKEIDQVALLVFASGKGGKKLGGGRVLHVGQFMQQIHADLRTRPVAKAAVPEQFSLLRAMQFAAQYWDFDGKPPSATPAAL